MKVLRINSPDQYTLVETVKTLPKAKTMGLDLKTHRLFLPTEESSRFTVLIVGK